MQSERLGFKSVLLKVKNMKSGENEMMKVIDTNQIDKKVLSEVISELREINSKRNENLMSINLLKNEDDYLYIKTYYYDINLFCINPEESGIYDILLGICNGIKELNEYDKYHGNLKRSNIFIDEDKKVILSDYLLLKLYKGSEKIRNVESLDDICYISYEELLNLEIDKSVDIWLFGCIFYYLLKNENIFKGKNVLETMNNIRDCKYERFVGEFSEEYNNLLEKLIVKDINNRLKIDELIIELKSIKLLIIVIEMNEPQISVEPFEEEEEEEIELDSKISMIKI